MEARRQFRLRRGVVPRQHPATRSDGCAGDGSVRPHRHTTNRAEPRKPGRAMGDDTMGERTAAERAKRREHRRLLSAPWPVVLFAYIEGLAHKGAMSLDQSTETRRALVRRLRK